MRLPSYRYIVLKEESLTQQLSSIPRYDFYENSIVFDLMTMNESSQDKILTNLIGELNRKKLSQIPYRISIISISKLKFEGYTIYPNDRHLPSFHKRKEKSLNVRESSLLNKIKLKQRKLSQIDTDYYTETLRNYATDQKKIYNKQNFLNFLNYIEKLK